jgi:two-component system chemotaxis response regulator CheY
MPKALIVDDAAFIRVTLRNVLETEGFEVEEAENGSVAVEKYDEFKPDVVTMDITMPEMGGIQAVREIVAKDPNARVVMVSASGQRSVVQEALKSGAKDFIVKPFQADRVVIALKKAIG